MLTNTITCLLLGASFCAADSIQWTNIALSGCDFACYSTTSSDNTAGTASIQTSAINQSWLGWFASRSFNALQAGSFTIVESATAKYYTDSQQHNGSVFPSTVSFTLNDGTQIASGSNTALTNAIVPVTVGGELTATLDLAAGPYTLHEWFTAQGIPNVNWSQLVGKLDVSVNDPVNTPEPRWDSLVLIGALLFLMLWRSSRFSGTFRHDIRSRK